MAKKLARALIAALCIGAAAHATPTSTAVIATPPQPSWANLSVEQKTILSPLGNEWDRLDNTRRKKWLAIAERYKRMTPAEQTRLQDKMRDWAMLSPEQRLAARERFKEFNQLPPEERENVKQKWQEYRQQKDDEQRRKVEPAGGDTVPANPAQEAGK